MSKPKSEKRSKNYTKRVADFFHTVTILSKDEEKLKNFLTDILTESELRMIKRRFYVAGLLSEGKTVRETAETAGVGTDTVMRVVKKIRQGTGVMREVFGYSKKTNKVFLQKKQIKSKKWFFGVK